MAKKKGTRKPPIPTHNVTAPNVRKMAQATKTAKRKRREDFSQAAARIVREATKR
ncbi:MAG: hypothetical protein LAN64_16765 [Acidobacteriia bacterium]|nr:hypothetical protein [Terriglobia bacterium]